MTDPVSSGGWRDSERYARLRGIDRAGLMWEWLRRDPGYIAWHVRATEATRGASIDSKAAGFDPADWGCTFAENPVLAAPEARILWRAELDPGTLRVWADSRLGVSSDLVDPSILKPWLTIVVGQSAVEHVVLSDGWRRIRLDITRGSLTAGKPVLLRYLIEGTRSAESKIVPLRRFLHFYRHGYFAKSLYPQERRIDRWLVTLRVRDAIVADASHKDIARVLFGPDRVEREWDMRSDSLRSRIRRLASDARQMARGGFRSLMTGKHP